MIGRAIIFTALVAVAAMAATPANADWFFDAAADYVYDDNLSRGSKQIDIQDDHLLRALVTAGWYRQITDNLGGTLALNLKGEHYDEFDDLDNISIGISASLIQKFGLGALSPRLRASVRVGHHDFRDRPRDGRHYGFGFDLSKRFGSRWSLSLGYDFDARRSYEVNDVPILVTLFNMGGDSFNTTAHTVSLTGIFEVDNRLSLFGTYRWRDGDVVSSTETDFPVLIVSEATAFDPVFGPTKVAYRVDARTRFYTAGASWALGPHTSIGANYDYIDTNGPGPADYNANIYSINVLYAY